MTLREREYKSAILSSLRFSERFLLDRLDEDINLARRSKPAYNWYLSKGLWDLNTIDTLRRKIKKGDLFIDIYLAVRRCDL